MELDETIPIIDNKTKMYTNYKIKMKKLIAEGSYGKAYDGEMIDTKSDYIKNIAIKVMNVDVNILEFFSE